MGMMKVEHYKMYFLTVFVDCKTWTCFQGLQKNPGKFHDEPGEYYYPLLKMTNCNRFKSLNYLLFLIENIDDALHFSIHSFSHFKPRTMVSSVASLRVHLQRKFV